MANYSKIYRAHYKAIKDLAFKHYHSEKPNSKTFAHGFNSLWSVYTVLCVHRTFGSKNDSHNKCSFSLSGLATATGLGKATVQKAIFLLESIDLISTEKGKGYHNTTLFSFPQHTDDEKKEIKPIAKQALNLAEYMKGEGVKPIVKDNVKFTNKYTGQEQTLDDLRKKWASNCV